MTDRRPEVLGINRRNLEFVFADYQPGKFRDLDDKAKSKALLSRANVPVPTTLATLTIAADDDALFTLLQEQTGLVLKPARGFGGRGILVLGRPADTWIRPDGVAIDIEDIVSHVREIQSGVYSLDDAPDICLVEERVHPDPFFRALFAEGLADIRIVLENGEPLQAMARIPTNDSDAKANLHAGAIGVGIEMTTGELTGGILGNQSIDRHPDSGASLKGSAIPQWSQCVAEAVRAAKAVTVDYVGVDLVVDAVRGPLVLEVNARPGLAIQLANRAGQPVPAATPNSAFQSFTYACGWAGLAVLLLGPLSWGSQLLTAEAPLTVELRGDSSVMTGPGSEDQTGIEWDSEEIALSEQSQSFQSALTALAEGDTAGAMAAYRKTAQTESDLAPFALNNLALLHRARGELADAHDALAQAVEVFPAYARGRYNLALVLDDIGASDRAMDELRTALELRPSYARAWARLGSHHFNRREFLEAERAYTSAIRYEPDYAAARLRLGLTQRLRGDLPGAAATLAELLTLEPRSEPGAFWLARTLVESSTATADSVLGVLSPHLGRRGAKRCLALAIDQWWERGAWTKAAETAGSLMDRRYRTQTNRKKLAWVSIALGVVDRGVATAASLGDDDPVRQSVSEHARLLTGLGETDPAARRAALTGTPLRGELEVCRLALLGNLEAAAQRLATMDSTATHQAVLQWMVNPGLDEALAIWSQDPPAPTRLRDHLEHGAAAPTVVLWAASKLAEARQDPTTARRLLRGLARNYPAFRPARRDRFFIHRKEERHDSARLAGRGLLKQVPHDVEVRLEMVALELEQDNAKEAREWLDGLDDAAQQTVEAQLWLSRVLHAEQDFDQAVDVLRALKRRAPGEPRVAEGLAALYTDRGEPGRASKELTEAVASNPNRIDLRRALAKAYTDANQYEPAAREWKRLARLVALTRTDRFQLALSLQRAGQLEGAVGEWDRYVSEFPTSHRGWYNRSLALERLGRHEEARDGFRHVLQLNPQHTASQKKLNLAGGSR